MTTEDQLFQEALKNQERLEKEKKDAADKKASGGNFEYEEIEFLSLEDKKEKVFRILGNPVSVRKKETDPKLILQSQILTDKGDKYIKVNWPFVEKDGEYVPDPDWILTRLLSKVRESIWQKYEDGHKNEKGYNGEYVKLHKDTKIYKIVEENSKPTEKYKKNFYPSKKVIMNVIDRHDNWCKENKSAKILCSKRSPYTFKSDDGNDKTIYFVETGIPYSTYLKIFNYYAKTRGNWFNMDTVVRKDSDNKDYDVYNSIDRICGEDSVKIANNDPLSEEEKNYKLYNLDKLYGVTSYYKLNKEILGKFKLCDAELGTHFTEELEELLKKENLNKQENSSKDEENFVETKPSEKEESKSIDLEDTKPDTFVENQLDKSEIENLCSVNFKFWNSLVEEDKKILVDSIKYFKGIVPVYKQEIHKNLFLCANKSCKYEGTDVDTEVPEVVKMCPVCGVKLA